MMLAYTSVNELLSTKSLFWNVWKWRTLFPWDPAWASTRKMQCRAEKPITNRQVFSTSDTVLLHAGSTGLEQPNSITLLQEGHFCSRDFNELHAHHVAWDHLVNPALLAG